MAETGPFHAWLGMIAEFSLSTINLGNLTVDGINNLLSDTFHLSPRITQPLASVLLNKTGGNCLSLLKMLESLKDQGLVYVDMRAPRWSWDLNKILDLEISHDVVVILVQEMRRLPAELQMGLQIASCLGNCVKFSVLDILSRVFCINLLVQLRLASEKGFMKQDRGNSSFSFVHDKVQQAAKELLSEQQRLELHIQLGLAICSHTLENEAQNDELFFMSVNQINCGGKGVLSEPGRANMVVLLNMKAGKLAITYTDFNSALKFFEHGISFLDSDHWESQYLLSIELFDLAADAACIINDGEAVSHHADKVLKHARCFDDTLNCLYITTKALRQASRLHESMQSSFAIIEQCGEELPQPMNEKVVKDLQFMNATLLKMTDESIISMEQTTDKRITFLTKLYAELANMLHWTDPSLVGAVSLRLADLALRKGLTPLCPLAFVHLGMTLANLGDEYIIHGSRLGRLALKLVDKGNSSTCKASVIFFVYQSTLWATVPLQAIVDAFRQGHSVGERSGDYLYSTMNYFAAHMLTYLTGGNLSIVRKKLRGSMLKMQGKENKQFVGQPNAAQIYAQCVALQDGEDRLNEESLDGILGLAAVMRSGKLDATVRMNEKILFLQRSFYFRRFDRIALDASSILEDIQEHNHYLRPVLLLGIFFEGLVAFQCARRATDMKSREKWYNRGESVSKRMWSLCDHSSWNWKNKALLLVAEKLYTDGNFDCAASSYDRAIQSAKEHRFVHEEAIASELAGDFYYERDFHEKSMTFFKHSMKCYLNWGAFAVAQRLQNNLEVKYGLDIAQLEPNNDSLEAISLSEADHSRKRQGVYQFSISSSMHGTTSSSKYLRV